MNQPAIQFKIIINEPDAFLDRVKDVIDFSGPKDHVYTYYLLPSNESEVITLRIKESPKGTSIDLKVKNNETNKREHFESGIDNPEQVGRIFGIAIGEPTAVFKKHRYTYKNDFVRLDLDLIKNLGNFLEVKYREEDTEQAEELLEKLGVSDFEREPRGNVEIFLQS